MFIFPIDDGWRKLLRRAPFLIIAITNLLARLMALAERTWERVGKRKRDHAHLIESAEGYINNNIWHLHSLSIDDSQSYV